VRNTQEIAWRRFWLKNVMLDAVTSLAAKIRRRPVTRRMSLVRRLEQLHQLQATAGPKSAQGSPRRIRYG
jgi:hypothetical protein